jgi:hypothetical protein
VVGEGGQLSREAELTVLEGLPEASDELAAKDSRQHLEGKKEPVLRFHPVSVIETQPTGGNDAVDMGMHAELLIPSVQHTEETNFRAEVSRIASNFEKRFGAGAEQQAIDELFVL